MERSRTFYAKKNILFGILGKLLIIVLEFVSRAVFIKFLGEELLGINGVFTNVLQILSRTRRKLREYLAKEGYAL